MPSTFDTTEPPEWFTPPGTLQVTAAALELARDFAEHARAARPDADWIVSFDWADSRRIRLPNNQWEELGPGIDLVAYERRNVPAGATQIAAGVEFAVKVPDHVYERGARLIERDDLEKSKLKLR